MSSSDSSSPPQLHCSLFSSGAGQSSGPSTAIICKQEAGKKSSFLLQPEAPITIVKPAHLKFEYRSNPNVDATSPFFLGGFQLISNAKHVEVYLTDKEGKETYLMTSKGIQFEKGPNGEEWFKAVSVVPGGPRPVTMLHIKLLSLKPKDATLAFLQSIKITARIPDASLPQAEQQHQKQPAQVQSSSPAKKAPSPSRIPSLSSSSSPSSSPASKPQSPPTTKIPEPSAKLSSSSSSSSSSSPTFTVPSPPGNNNNNALTQQDLGAAMSSLSLMAKNAEDRIENTMCERFSKMEGFLEAKWDRMEKHVFSLTSVVISQKTLLGQKLKVIHQQQETLNAQAEQLATLTQLQKDMSDKITSLAADMTKMKKVMQVVVDRGETATATAKDHEEQREKQGDLMKEQTGRIDVLIEHQREIQVRVHTLQLQVSELSQGLQPIIEREETDDDDGEEESRLESVATGYSSSDDLMQFPDSDEELEATTSSLQQHMNTTEEDSIQSAPTLSLHEHFATTNTTGKVLKGGSKMDESVQETADMTDMASLQHIQKIEVNLLDDSSEVKLDEASLIPAGASKASTTAATAASKNVQDKLLISLDDDNNNNNNNGDNEQEPPVVLEKAPDILSREEAVVQEPPSSKRSDQDHPPKGILSFADGLRLLRELAFDFASDGHLEVDFVENNHKSTDDGKPNEGSGGLLVDVS